MSTQTPEARLFCALAATAAYGTPGRLRAALKKHGLQIALQAAERLDDRERTGLLSSAAELASRHVDACLLGDDAYPRRLATIASAPPVLFLFGNVELLHVPSVGMCGSRNSSDHGLRAALTCGEEVAAHGLTIVSGYAKGVDSQTHLAALKSGGRTVIVLAEGINHFRTKRMFAETGLPSDRVLVVSQFPPSQKWTVGGAMTRNAVIAGLACALVVIEAAEKGGTLNAGVQALDMGRPVLALDFKSSDTPPGNQLLFERGAAKVSTRQELGRILDGIDPGAGRQCAQLPLL